MSEIPFVKQLGDAIENAIASEATGKRHRWAWLDGASRRGTQIILLGASLLVVAGVVAVALTLGPASPHKVPGGPVQPVPTTSSRTGTHRGLGPAAINLPPGVVTVARLRLPDGKPFSLTLQRIRFERQQYVCLAVTEKFSAAPGQPGGGSETGSQCNGPLPLPDKPLVAVEGYPTACKPRPAQLIWGLALKDVTVELRVGGREQAAARRAIPTGLDARGTLFFIWARSAPDSLVARSSSGRVAETYPINGGRAPAFGAVCKLHPPPNVLGSVLQQSQSQTPR